MELFANRVWATLASGMDEVQTSLALSTGHGARFGTIGSGDKLRIVLLDATLNVSEIMYATARVGDTLTVDRAQDGTVAVVHLAGDRLEHRIGKSTMDSLTQKAKAGTDAVAEMHAATSKATPVDADEFMAGDSASTFGVIRVTWANIKATLLSTWKDATGGLVGMTLFAINFKNAANTFTSFLTNTNTAARTYLFKDRNGTIADDTDVTTLTAAAAAAQTVADTAANMGPNYLRNGSFEDGLAGWTATAYVGGTVASSTTAHMNGAKSLAITSTVLANGGGDVVSNEYTPVTEGEFYSLYGDVRASVANISSKIEIIWYDSTKAQVSASLVYSSINTPTAFAHVGTQRVAPATARFMRVRAIGGEPALGSAVGTINFDGFALGGAEALKPGDVVYTSSTSAKPGTLKMNGAAVSRTAYPGLFAQIDTIFGVGDGSTTFNVPETRGEFIRCLADGRAVDTGRALGSYQAGQNLSHDHIQTYSIESVSGTTQSGHMKGYEIVSDGNINNGSYNSTTVSGGGEARPRNVALLACIKY